MSEKKKKSGKTNVRQLGLINISKTGTFSPTDRHSVDIASSGCPSKKEWQTKETPDQNQPMMMPKPSGSQNSGVSFPKTIQMVVLAIALIGIILVGVLTMSNATETFNAIFKLVNLL